MDESAMFSFGVIADIQYADIDDRENYQRTCWRHYRESLNVLKQAVNHWNKQSETTKISFVLQLGDILDGFNTLNNDSQTSLQKLLEEFSKFKGDVYHNWGNHELVNFLRMDLLESKLNSSPYKTIQPVENRKAYYDFSPHEKFVFIVLDTYEIGVHGYEKGHPIRIDCETYLEKWNPNDNKKSSIGMVGRDKRIVNYNAAVSEEQLKWLDGVLKKAQQDNKYVVMSGHQPIYEPASQYITICWNYDKILDVIHKYTCVVAYFAGHDHDGGYAVDEHGVHHITFHGAVEGDIGNGDFGTVHVYKDRMELKGHGRIPNRTIHLPDL